MSNRITRSGATPAARSEFDDAPAGLPPNCHRKLEPADLDVLYSLHIQATEAVGRPDLIRAETRAFFDQILTGAGRVDGVFDADGLLAYGVLQWRLPAEEDLRSVFHLPPDAPFAKLAGASVRPRHWGSGLHEWLIDHRIEVARDRGLRHLYATAAPGNVRSWENLLNRGFAIRALVEQYGGQLRYIVYRDVDADASGDKDPCGSWCDVGDVDGQHRLLEAGMEGIGWRRTSVGREIRWRQRS